VSDFSFLCVKIFGKIKTKKGECNEEVKGMRTAFVREVNYDIWNMVRSFVLRVAMGELVSKFSRLRGFTVTLSHLGYLEV
jgi:hypothetical protein